MKRWHKDKIWGRLTFSSLGRIMSSTQTSKAFRFLDYSVRPHSRTVYKNGTHIRLYGQSFEILLMLVDRTGDVVTRGELKN